jgi:hypothetical protein
MSLGTYDDLQAAIARTLNRDDLSDSIPDFIALAEAAIDRTLRHWRMETRATADVSDRFFAVPADWLQTIRVLRPEGGRIGLVSHADLQDRRAASLTTGAPVCYAMAAGAFEFYPVPDASYEVELLYYARAERLSLGSATNWILETYPDLYLYGALIHSAPFLGEDARLQVWGALYAAAMEGANSESRAAVWSGTGLRKRF